MGRLKKFVYISISLVAVLILSLFLTACGNGYTPESGSNYFEVNGAYRVLDENPEHEEVKAFPLHSDTLPFFADKVGETVSVTSTEFFDEGSMFFQSAAVTKQGVIAIYKALGKRDYWLSDERFHCNFTGLYTYNVIRRSGSSTYTAHLSGYTGRVGVGAVADVDKYTFSYKDLSMEDGSEMGEGSLTVYICKVVYADVFQLN